MTIYYFENVIRFFQILKTMRTGKVQMEEKSKDIQLRIEDLKAKKVKKMSKA